jgi:hypothetical protein
VSNQKKKREDALVTALSVTDTARRVGWAKYYSSAEQADELSRDLNMARSDRDLVSRFAGYLYGALGVAAPSIISKLPEAVDRLGVLGMLPSASIDAGRRTARRRAGRSDLAKAGLHDADLVRSTDEIISDRKNRREERRDWLTCPAIKITPSSEASNTPIVRRRADGCVRIERGRRQRVCLTNAELINLRTVLDALIAEAAP